MATGICNHGAHPVNKIIIQRTLKFIADGANDDKELVRYRNILKLLMHAERKHHQSTHDAEFLKEVWSLYIEVTLRMWRSDFLGLHERFAAELTKVPLQEESMLRFFRVTLQLKLLSLLKNRIEEYTPKDEDSSQLPCVFNINVETQEPEKYINRLYRFQEKLLTLEQRGVQCQIDVQTQAVGDVFGSGLQIREEYYPRFFSCGKGKADIPTKDWMEALRIVVADYLRETEPTQNDPVDIKAVRSAFERLEIGKRVQAIWHNKLQEALLDSSTAESQGKPFTSPSRP